MDTSKTPGGHEEKLLTAKQKKAEADEAYRVSDLPKALRYYHEALLFLKGLDSNTTDVIAGNSGDQSSDTISPEKKEINATIEKVYSNMCACLIKQGKWQRAINTADQVLAKNADHVKAKLRKARALRGLGMFEKADVILKDLSKAPSDKDRIDVEAERKRLKDKEKEVTKETDNKMRGFLNNDRRLLAKDEKGKEPQGAYIEEVDSTPAN